MKAVGIVIALVVLIGAGVAWWVSTSLDREIATIIEETGTDLLGATVSVASVKTSLREGSAAINGLKIANPTGDGLSFSSKPAFELDEIAVGIDISALGDGPVPIKFVRVVAPRLNAELTASGLNLDVLRKGMGNDDGAVESNGENASGDDDEETQLRIDLFEFLEGSLEADTQAIGGDVRKVKLPAVRLTNLSGTSAEIGQQVLDVYLKKASKEVGVGRLEEEAKKQIDKAKKKAKKKAGDAARKLFGRE
ncbi:MAG: hypothetical protein ACI8W3_001306 [Myxococcota bacterium]|jgi:hypothetical protein